MAWPRSTPPRASTTSSSSATRSCSTTASPRSRRTRAGRRRSGRIAGNERRHAEIWAAKLARAGADVPPRRRGRGSRVAVDPPARPAVRDACRPRPRHGPRGRRGGRSTRARRRPRSQAIAADEREHAEIWQRLKRRAVDAAARPHRAQRHRRSARALASVRPLGDAPGGHLRRQRRARLQPRPRDGRRRARGAAQGRFILLAGIAGLLAGAFSMAAGEYISMQSQRELFERQIELERAELEAMPEEEEAEMRRDLPGQGLPADEAKAIAARLFEDPEHALDTLIREELGLDPDELGSPWGAAVGSFVAFAHRRGRAGPAVPVRRAAAGVRRRASALSLGGAVRGRRRGQPAHRPERPVLRGPPGGDRGGGGRGDLPRRPAHRGQRHLAGQRKGAPCRVSGTSPAAWRPHSR